MHIWDFFPQDDEDLGRRVEVINYCQNYFCTHWSGSIISRTGV